ncbi:MAG: LysR substrate-binding domain-containing protein [Bdellovibrionales bacterium]
MNQMALSLRDLQYLVTVAETEHFGRAAVLCNVSQPALSTQIKKVEDVLGILVFERSNRRVRVTEGGKPVIQAAREVLQAAERLSEAAVGEHLPLTTSLKVGAIASLGPYFWPHFLAPLKRQFPKLPLILREGLTENLIQQLRSGGLDAVLASPTFETSGLIEQPLFFEPFFLAAPSGHVLAEQKLIEIKDLNANDMVLLEDGHCLKDQTVDLCPANRRGHIREAHATSVETLRQLVATGAGYTLLPALSVEGQQGLGGLIKYRPMKSARAGRLICLYSRPRSGKNADVEALSRFFKSNLPHPLRPVG